MGRSDEEGRRQRRRDDRRRRRSRSRSRSRERRRSPSPDADVERHKSEIDDLTKDQRTVFVSQLVMKASERQIRSFFEKVGKVKDVIMIRDKYTNRHKGFAYVEMANLESVPMVLMLNGTLPDFQKFPILVKASEAEKNFLAKQEANAAQQEAEERQMALPPVATVRRKLVLGNLHPDITETDLRTVLAPFGDVEDVELAVPGEAFVTFTNADDALKASAKIGGIELGADKPITVKFAEQASVAAAVGGGAATTDWRLDSDEQGGMAMNAQSRAALMAQLGQRAGMGAQAAYAPAQPQKPAKLEGPPKEAFVMANMFDPTSETDPHWRRDIREDVTAECGKYGKVVHIHVDSVSPRGLVHCLFQDLASAESAATHLHGRWFAGRAITVTFVDPRTHRAQFASEM
ncbi:hypothetical protein CTAYLR_006398 [Chrysophaeum taylorii]|uniref:RRM domain-containing protein n=1 Tax=Chrysophaeum taylorii TaxID=2483200 RepID=A0AAD7XK79_9STRA|nr:hypothetical protein CTAYLR_006398 [Chrysophaeum taylorii]